MNLKKIMKFFCYSFFLLLFLSGCITNDTSANDGVFQFKDSFVGDNSAVGAITNQLPGAEQLHDFELKTKEEPYGIVLNYDWTASEQEYREAVIHSATFLVALVQNVDWVMFHSDIDTYTITKENLQEWYGKGLNNFQNEQELTGLIQEYVKDHNKVNQLLN